MSQCFTSPNYQGGYFISNRYGKVMWNKSPKRDIYQPWIWVHIVIFFWQRDCEKYIPDSVECCGSNLGSRPRVKTENPQVTRPYPYRSIPRSTPTCKWPLLARTRPAMRPACLKVYRVLRLLKCMETRSKFVKATDRKMGFFCIKRSILISGTPNFYKCLPLQYDLGSVHHFPWFS